MAKDFLEELVRNANERRAEKEALEREMHMKYALIEEKYKDLLVEYQHGQDELTLIVNEIQSRWVERLTPYRKERNAVGRKYRRLIKAIK